MKEDKDRHTFIMIDRSVFNSILGWTEVLRRFHGKVFIPQVLGF
jgi:hypothetical protein